MKKTLSNYLSVKHEIAYFSMEIGLNKDIPTYSGGLGILAGDTLKAFADEGLDVVAVTLLSEKGYFNQTLDESGYQHENDVVWDKKKFLKRLDQKIQLQISGRTINVGAWEHIITGYNGKPLRVIYLDTNIEGNSDSDRNLTSYLYGGDKNYRLEQEIILGIGGIRMLRALDVYPKKYHMNEGHAAFLILELQNELTELIDSFEQRRKLISDLCSFTTHTPVAAGHDTFDVNQVKDKIGNLFPYEFEGQLCKDNIFSMTLLALNFSSYTNAVARKHRDVSQSMFPEFKIDYITNGVHSTTWTNAHLAKVLDTHIVDWRANPLELRNVHKVPLNEIMFAHKKAKQDLFNYIKEKNGVELDIDTFTLGFARRATGYKRAELLFKDIERLKAINREVGNIQIIYAGKAHPNDGQGKEIIQHIINLCREFKDSLKIVFLENYDMGIGKLLVSGVDLWLNTPKRPLEASGTSGMKAAHNGVPSLSILDGWWIEGCIEGVTGWAIGDVSVSGDDGFIDELDSQSLYTKLAQNIVSLYYSDYESYASIMRSTISINASYFNTHRMVKQYMVRAYARKMNLE